MAIETTCGGCGKLLSVGDEHAGRRARCPSCGQIYTVPSPTPSADSQAGLTPPSDNPFADTSAGPTESASSSESTDVTTPDSSGSPGSSGANAFPPPLRESTPPQPAADANQFWMRTPEGAEYGPVDRGTLDRWFNEGRVGPGYMIRQSAAGIWQPAELSRPVGRIGSGPQFAGQFAAQPSGQPQGQPLGRPAAPMASASTNPYAATNTYAGNAPQGYRPYLKADQSGLVLAFGILSWFLCPIFGVIALIMGRTGLSDIAAGFVDPANKGLMQAGYYLGLVHVLLLSVCIGGYLVFIAVAVIAGAVN